MHLVIIPIIAGLHINPPYYFDPRIHSFGNVGIGGRVHANLAYASTKFIDRLRYRGRDIRREIYQPYIDDGLDILDMCCGIGISTPAGHIGIDTSVEMLQVARRVSEQSINNNYINDNNDNDNNKKLESNSTEFYCGSNSTEFYWGNAEYYRPKKSIDVVTCMFAFHEMPNYAHVRIIDNALMIAKKEFVIVDIAPDYKSGKPPEIMLRGEPYLLNYLDTIQDILHDFEETVYIPGHVHIWRYKK